MKPAKAPVCFRCGSNKLLEMRQIAKHIKLRAVCQDCCVRLGHVDRARHAMIAALKDLDAPKAPTT